MSTQQIIDGWERGVEPYAKKHYRNWVCRCGQIVLDYEKPQPIRWTDGHVCYFSEEVPTA